MKDYSSEEDKSIFPPESRFRDQSCSESKSQRANGDSSQKRCHDDYIRSFIRLFDCRWYGHGRSSDRLYVKARGERQTLKRGQKTAQKVIKSRQISNFVFEKIKQAP